MCFYRVARSGTSRRGLPSPLAPPGLEGIVLAAPRWRRKDHCDHFEKPFWEGWTDQFDVFRFLSPLKRPLPSICSALRFQPRARILRLAGDSLLIASLGFQLRKASRGFCIYVAGLLERLQEGYRCCFRSPWNKNLENRSIGIIKGIPLPNKI